MKTSILKGLDEQEKAELKAEFISCHRLRARLVEQLESRISNVYQEMLDSDATAANWAVDQASKVGEVRATKKLIALLSN